MAKESALPSNQDIIIKDQRIPVSRGFGELLERRASQGEFERIAREERDLNVLALSKKTGLGGVSTPSGAAIVDIRGNTVGGVTTFEGERLVSSRGDLIDLPSTGTPSFVISEARPRGRVERSFDAIGRTVGVSDRDRRSVRSFGAGLSTGFSQPVSSSVELFGGRSGVFQRGSGLAPDSAFLAGQLVGVGANVPSGRLIARGFSFGAGFVRPLASRVGLTPSQASRVGVGLGVGAGLGVVGAGLVSSSRIDDPRARAFSFADIAGQSALQVGGALTASRSSLASSRAAGDTAGRFVDSSVPVFGRFDSVARTDPFRAASISFSRATAPRTNLRGIDAETISVSPGGFAFSTSTNPARPSTRFPAQFRIDIPLQDGTLQTTLFNPRTRSSFVRTRNDRGEVSVVESVGFSPAQPRITQDAVFNFLEEGSRGGFRQPPIDVTLREFAIIRRESQSQRVFGSRDISPWDEALARSRGDRSLRDFSVAETPTAEGFRQFLTFDIFGGRRGQASTGLGQQLFRPSLRSQPRVRESPPISSLRLPPRKRIREPSFDSDFVPIATTNKNIIRTPKPITGFSPIMIISQNNALRSILMPKNDFNIKNLFITRDPILSRTKQNIRQETAITPQTILTPETTTQTRTRLFPTGTGGGTIIPRDPPLTDKKRIIRPIAIPSLGGLRENKRKRKREQKDRTFSFRPSISGATFNIKEEGKKQRLFTGLELRGI